MEISETAACGISERKFALICEDEDLPEIYRIMHFAQTGIGHYEEEMAEDIQSQMHYIVGPEADEEPAEDATREGMVWKEEDGKYHLVFSQGQAGLLMQIVRAVQTPGQGFDQQLNERLMAQLKSLAPSLLDNLPIINR